MKCDYTKVIFTHHLEEKIYNLALGYWEEQERVSKLAKKKLKDFVHYSVTYFLKERGKFSAVENKESLKGLVGANNLSEVPHRIKKLLALLFNLVEEVSGYQMSEQRLDHKGQFSKEFQQRMGGLATPEAIYQYFFHLKFLNQESMKAVYLKDYQLLQTKNLFLGGANSMLVTAREIIAPAIKLDANQMILVHNHPSGNSQPSDKDFEFTRKVLQVARKLEIYFLDHLIIGDYFFSFRKEGLL